MPRHLRDDMRRRAEAVYAEAFSVARELQRAIADQPGAEQRRRLGVAELSGIGNSSARRRRLFGIAAIDLVAGEARVVAEIFLPSRQ